MNGGPLPVRIAGISNSRKRGGTAQAVLLGGAVSLLALPSAVLAFSTGFDFQPAAADAPVAGSGTFQPTTVDPRLARSISVRALSKGRTFRFTPAATPSRLDRSVTVAVRLDPVGARAITVRGSLAAVQLPATTDTLRISPTAYRLGATRGYKSFAQNLVAEPRKPDIPDLASFKPAPRATSTPGRFAPRIELDEKEKAGRSARNFEGPADETVDVGGSYRLTRNLNVTAGVRYSAENRLVPLTDGRQDNQAVYVGTQFRF